MVKNFSKQIIGKKYFPGGWLNFRSPRYWGKRLRPAQEMVTLQSMCVSHLVTRGNSQDKAVPPRLGYFQKTIHFLKQKHANCVFLDIQDLQYRQLRISDMLNDYFIQSQCKCFSINRKYLQLKGKLHKIILPKSRSPS